MQSFFSKRIALISVFASLALFALGAVAVGSIMASDASTELSSAKKAKKARHAAQAQGRVRSKARGRAKARSAKSRSAKSRSAKSRSAKSRTARTTGGAGSAGNRLTARRGESTRRLAAVTRQPRAPAAPALQQPAEAVPLPRPRPGRRAATVPMPPPAPATPVSAAALTATADPSRPASGRMFASAVPMLVPPMAAAAASFMATPRPSAGNTPALSYAPAAAPPPADVDAVKEAISLAQRGNIDAAMQRKSGIRDSAGQKLVEWTILRARNATPGFGRYADFVQNNGHWPSTGMLRRRAEAQIWQEKPEPAAVFRFFSEQPPGGPLGRLSLARALLAQGDHGRARALIQEAWTRDSLSEGFEEQVLRDFGAVLTRQDHKLRLDMRLYGDDFDAAQRAAKRLGDAEVALVAARRAVSGQSAKAGALLDAVPRSLHADPVFVFTRIQWLRRADRTEEATRLALSVPHAPHLIPDPDEWWLERRILVRRLLDEGKFQEAYRISRDAVQPTGREHLRVDQPFTAGWIALRFLNDPQSATRHFARIAKVTDHPTSLARAGYWLGRAAEAQGLRAEARRHYEAAAQHAAAYYGQLARARLGHREMVARQPPALGRADRAALRQVELVRAVELLYATGNRELVTTFVADLDRVNDVGVLTLIGEIARHNNDPRAMLYLGRDAISRGFALDAFAFPTLGLPKYSSLGPPAEHSLVYSIARQESAFMPTAVSSARAVGYMQVTPAAGKTIARRHGIKFDAQRLRTDPVYNMQMGAAEIASLVREYDGNHALAFAAYNAGRGRVREWIGRFGDPRDPRIDCVDWVERIPFFETRNYVQRVMENMQVYRAQFHATAPLTIEADLRGRSR